MTMARTTYAIRVEGHLDDHWSDWFGDLDLKHNADGSTTITVDASDQSRLHGVLGGLRDIGAVITELRAGGVPGRSALERPLRTERLLLRPATRHDADPTWAYRRLEWVNEWLTGCPAELDDYRSLFGEPDRLANTVIVVLGHDTAGPVIGDFMLRREDAWSQLEVADQARGRQAELGWVLDPAYTGHGYATEAVRALISYCFHDLGMHRVTANCFLDNDTSWRLMERVGMRREQHAVAESLHRTGRWLDTLGYAILATEWTR